MLVQALSCFLASASAVSMAQCVLGLMSQIHGDIMGYTYIEHICIHIISYTYIYIYIYVYIANDNVFGFV